MTKTIKSVLLLCCVLSGLLIYSCTKNNSSQSAADTETQTAADNSFAQSTNDDVTSVSAQSEDNGVAGSYHDSTSSYILSPCATITFNLASSPYTLTINFGNTNCRCYDGKYRRGEIIVTYNGRYRDSGSVHSITFNDYYVNNYKVDGTQTVTNNGRNTAGNTSFTVQDNTTITDTAGHKLTFASTRTREWVQGESTSGIGGWRDDVYSITGSASGTTFSGASYTENITNPLIVALNCHWITKGTVEFTPSGKLTRTIDFGNGDCDNKATVTIAGITFNILLP